MGMASLDPPPKYSTDLLALRVAGRGIVPPISDMRWGTAGTSGACTWFHIDANGLGVFIILKCGLKIWFFLRDDEGKFRIINCFQDFELDEANGYHLEAVVLRPGTIVYVDYLSLSAIAIMTTLQCHASQHCSLRGYPPSLHLPRRAFFQLLHHARHASRHHSQLCGSHKNHEHKSSTCCFALEVYG